MSTEHTPGPWHTTGRDIFDRFVRYQVRDERGRLLAEMSWHESSDERFPKGWDVAEANAALMAAAPDLLAALRKVYEALMSDPPHGPQKHVGPDDVIYQLDGQLMYQAINAARDALALVIPKGAAAAEANADLIAAAPDMLAKLEEIADECATCMGCAANECPDCADIREVIAKARGSRENNGS